MPSSEYLISKTFDNVTSITRKRGRRGRIGHNAYMLTEIERKAYYSWKGMKRRCFGKIKTDFANYRGRGITVCDRWMTYENFITDMGVPPTLKHTLDRIDVDGNYEPSNCKWSTQKEQQNNRTNNVFVEYNGQRFTISQLGEYLSIPNQRIRYGLRRGWTIEEVIRRYKH